MSSRSIPMRLLGLITKATARMTARTAGGANADDPRAPEVPVLDIEVFRELYATLGSNTPRLRNVYAKFLDSAAQRVEELRNQPAAATARTLHALKGSAGMVGASRLAARLQEATVASDMFIGEIDRELADFRAALDLELSTL